MNIRDVTLADAEAIVTIYNQYIESTTITFEEQLLTIADMSDRIEAVIGAGYPWLVIEIDGAVKGYAYASAWKARSAYRFTVEPSIYLEPGMCGKGYGKMIYRALLTRLKAQGIKNVLGVIALPNASSSHLHESLGFKKVGEFSNVGYKFGHWVSVGYWQLTCS